MKRRVAGLLFCMFMLISLCFCTKASANDRFIIKQIIPDTAGNLIIVTGDGNHNPEYKTFKLSAPDRMVVDVYNAILAGKKRTLQVNNENIKDLKITQYSVNPDVVRLVLTSDSADTLNKIKLNKNKNALIFDLNKIEPTNIASNPLYRDREILNEQNNSDNSNNNTKPAVSNTGENTDKETIIRLLQNKIDHNIVLKLVKHTDNRVLITGTGIISVTEPMILDNPKRIAFDILDAIASSSDILQAIPLKNGDLIRIGQFNNNTVRVVIESKKAELYKTIISPDMQSILIAPENEVSFNEFPDSTSVGDIQDIKVITKDNKTTQIAIVSAKPIIHDVERSDYPNRLILEMYNLKKPKKYITSNLANTGQFNGMVFENLNNYINGSKIIFPLNKNTKVESRLSLDGRMLEITLKDTIPVITVTKRSSSRRIVIDAGHGGQEPGAVRAGIYEKDITIDIAKRVRKYLQRAGIEVIMTREDDESVSLKQRTEITNVETPNAFVSIHVNSSENSGVTGLETYYYTPQSKELAKSVHLKIANYINSPDRGIRTARFYVIRNTETPAILAEIGYLSNDAERNEILSEERKNTTAKAIAEGIINYLK